MKLKGTIECFRFAFGILVFVRSESFLTRVMSARIFQKPSEQWNELASEKLYITNVLKMTELNPVSKFELGPFESVDDSFYKSRFFFDAVNDNNRNMLEKMAEIFVDDIQQKQPRKAGDEKTPNISEQKEIINSKVYQMSSLNQALPRNIFSSKDRSFSPKLYQNFRNVINRMKLQMKKLKKLSRLMLNLQTNFQEFEISSLEFLEKILQMLEELKSTTINHQLQIDSIFFINGLLVEESRKEADAQLASLAVKGILNNLKEETTLPHTPTNPSATSNASIKSYDLDSFKQLQKNFSKIFNQDVTLEQINQISKIVDFVERYHGEVGNLKILDLSGKEVSRKIKKKGGRRVTRCENVSCGFLEVTNTTKILGSDEKENI